MITVLRAACAHGQLQPPGASRSVMFGCTSLSQMATNQRSKRSSFRAGTGQGSLN